jgi:hypothetical protein
MSKKKTKNSPPSSHHGPVDRCPSCGNPCDIEKDLDDKDYCNDCRPSPSKVKPTPHVVANANSQSFVCNNCEAIQAFPPFPIEITKFNRIARKFMKKHQNCKTKTDGK